MAVNYGLAAFDDSVKPVILGGRSPVTTNHGMQGGNIADEVNKLMQCLFDCGTNYALSASNKHIIFLSDGKYSGDISAALVPLKTLDVKIFSFAVGSESNCTNALQQMAHETSGLCKHITSAAELNDELNNLVMSKMMNNSLTVDSSLVGVMNTKAPLFDGPSEDQLSYTVPASSLAVGHHAACISAIGGGPADVPASEEMVGCCVTFKVKA